MDNRTSSIVKLNRLQATRHYIADLSANINSVVSAERSKQYSFRFSSQSPTIRVRVSIAVLSWWMSHIVCREYPMGCQIESGTDTVGRTCSRLDCTVTYTWDFSQCRSVTYTWAIAYCSVHEPLRTVTYCPHLIFPISPDIFNNFWWLKKTPFSKNRNSSPIFTIFTGAVLVIVVHNLLENEAHRLRIERERSSQSWVRLLHFALPSRYIIWEVWSDVMLFDVWCHRRTRPQGRTSGRSLWVGGRWRSAR